VEYAWSERGPPTSLTAPAAAGELVAAYKAVTARPPALALAELNLAHQWLETKATRSMWRFNWGNLSAGGFVDGVERLAWKGDIWRPPWFELAADASPEMVALHEKMLAGKAPSAFRAYPGHPEGAQGYVKLLQRPGFAALLRAGQSGNPTAYAQAVVDTGYCRDRNCQPDRMGPALAELVARFRRENVFQGLQLPRPRSSSSAGAVVLIGLLLWSERKLS
jgi:hypothetical protein